MKPKSQHIVAALTAAILAVAAQSQTAAAADEPTAAPAGTGAAPTLRKIASSPDAERNIENFIAFQAEGVKGSMPNIKKYMAEEFLAQSSGSDSLLRLLGKDVVAGRVVKRDLMEKSVGKALSGIEGQKRIMEEIYGVGDEVIARWRITGVAHGPVFGLEGKGQPIDVTEIAFVRFDKEGRMVEGAFRQDSAELMRQLGYKIEAPQ